MLAGAIGAIVISGCSKRPGVVYILLGEPLAGLIPLTCCLLSSVSIIVFARLLRYEFFRFTQLLMMLLLPFLVMLRLGGHMNSRAVMLWSLMAPFGALIFGEPRGVWRWFAGFLAHGLLGPAGPYTLQFPVAAVFQQSYPRLPDRLTLIPPSPLPCTQAALLSC